VQGLSAKSDGKVSGTGTKKEAGTTRRGGGWAKTTQGGNPFPLHSFADDDDPEPASPK
jgi:hypothetical protein